MANLTITNSFSAGSTISSSQVNQNFTDIKTWLNNRDNATDTWLNVKGATIEATTILKGKGTISADDASTGYIGEYISSSQSTLTNVPGLTGVFGADLSVSLTAGDWDVSAVLQINANGATITRTVLVIGTTAGGAGSLGGDNTVDLPIALNGVRLGGGCIPSYRVNISSTTVYYLSMRLDYSVATPQYQARISARRVR